MAVWLTKPQVAALDRLLSDVTLGEVEDRREFATLVRVREELHRAEDAFYTARALTR